MALSSMTGFARLPFEADGEAYAWEIKSVNARGLELRLRLPPGLDRLEPEIRSRVRESVSRGSCFLTLQQQGGSESPRLMLNEEALAIVIAAARRLAAEEGIGMPTSDGLLAIPGVLSDGSAKFDEPPEERDAAILAALVQAVGALRSAREGEGARLAAVLEGQLAAIEKLVEQAGALAAEAPDRLKTRIREQVALLVEAGDLDPERLHQEAVLAATRADVREELDRLGSHLAGARELLASDGAVGRRLEFLAQEFNREANTLCSKAFDGRLTAVGLELKAVIDQFREQVQNLE